MSTILKAVVLTCLVVPSAGGETRMNAGSPDIELRLVADKAKVRIGEQPVRMRVELFNKGKHDFIAGGELEPITNAPTFLQLEFTDSKGAAHRGSVVNLWMNDQIRNEWWTRIAPGHYYGIEFDLDLETYPFMGVPESYTITAKYVSKGGATPPSPEWQVPSRHVWEGELSSNSVQVTVLEKAKP